ncbi:MAG: hypothetical protein AAGJ10_01350 [Bacteroidota bacterium]
METFHDGYIVNACYRSAKSRKWEPVEIDDRRGGTTERIEVPKEMHDGKVVIKEELMPDGSFKRILQDPETGAVSQTVS